MITVVTVALAVAVVALSSLDLWAYARKRFDLSARFVAAELVAAVGLLALAIADRDWMLTAVWVGCTALAAWQLRKINRKRQAHTA